jgi:hypothetical protein
MSRSKVLSSKIPKIVSFIPNKESERSKRMEKLKGTEEIEEIEKFKTIDKLKSDASAALQKVLDSGPSATTLQLAEIVEEGVYKKQIEQPWALGIQRLSIFYSKESYPKREYEQLQNLCRLFTFAKLKDYFLPLIVLHDGVSCRSIDWLVTNYSKKKKILVSHKITKQFINIYQNYKNWLRYYRRELFDPCRRNQRTYFEFKGQTHETTIAQINFLYWAETSGVLDFAQKNIKAIETDMYESKEKREKEKKAAADAGVAKKRHELSKQSSVNCTIYRCDAVTRIL